jgi:hypothetical protein
MGLNPLLRLYGHVGRVSPVPVSGQRQASPSAPRNFANSEYILYDFYGVGFINWSVETGVALPTATATGHACHEHEYCRVFPSSLVLPDR